MNIQRYFRGGDKDVETNYPVFYRVVETMTNTNEITLKKANQIDIITNNSKAVRESCRVVVVFLGLRILKEYSMKKIYSVLFLISGLSIAVTGVAKEDYASSQSKIGTGIGRLYAATGINFELMLTNYFSLMAGFGTNELFTPNIGIIGYSVGVFNYSFEPQSAIRPRLAIFISQGINVGPYHYYKPTLDANATIGLQFRILEFLSLALDTGMGTNSFEQGNILMNIGISFHFLKPQQCGVFY